MATEQGLYFARHDGSPYRPGDNTGGLLVAPERMSLWTLFSYVQHLRENRQESGRYEIALWNKIVYPFAILVMMVLALPFAYYQQRAGGVGHLCREAFLQGAVAEQRPKRRVLELRHQLVLAARDGQDDGHFGPNSAVESIKIASDFSEALHHKQLSLHYQPIINLQEGRVAGVALPLGDEKRQGLAGAAQR